MYQECCFLSVQRRTFLSALAAATGGSAAGIELTGRTSAASGQIPELEVYSSSSLVNENSDPLTDDSYVAVWAEDTAYNIDDDGSGDAVSYPDDTPIPVVASDWNVVGFGSMLVTDSDTTGRKATRSSSSTSGTTRSAVRAPSSSTRATASTTPSRSSRSSRATPRTAATP